MRRIRDRTGTVDTAQVAVLTALNVANRLLARRDGEQGVRERAPLDPDRIRRPDRVGGVRHGCRGDGQPESAVAEGAPEPGKAQLRSRMRGACAVRSHGKVRPKRPAAPWRSMWPDSRPFRSAPTWRSTRRSPTSFPPVRSSMQRWLAASWRSSRGWRSDRLVFSAGGRLGRPALPGRYGVAEPPHDIAARVPEALVLVPGVAFDARWRPAGSRRRATTIAPSHPMREPRPLLLGRGLRIPGGGRGARGAPRPPDGRSDDRAGNPLGRGRQVSGRDAEREIERQLEVLAEGSEAFHGVDDLRPRLGAGRWPAVLPCESSWAWTRRLRTFILDTLSCCASCGCARSWATRPSSWWEISRRGSATRRGARRPGPALDREDVQRNAETYVDQVGRVLDAERAEVRFNGEWMDTLSAADLVRLVLTARPWPGCSSATTSRGATPSEAPISLHEFLYPLVQAYDSVALEADVELGGTDQTFNLLMGREVQRHYGVRPQAVITHPLLVGTDGKEKMSKSLGNLIGIGRSARGDLRQGHEHLRSCCCSNWFDRLSFGEWSALESARGAVGEGAGDPLALKHDTGLAARVRDFTASRPPTLRASTSAAWCSASRFPTRSRSSRWTWPASPIWACST